MTCAKTGPCWPCLTRMAALIGACASVGGFAGDQWARDWMARHNRRLHDPATWN